MNFSPNLDKIIETKTKQFLEEKK